MKSFDWEGRPAIVVGAKAWAVPADDYHWTEVNFAEVLNSEYPVPSIEEAFPHAPRRGVDGT